MHLGTLAAVLLYFRVLILSLASGWTESVRSMRWDASPESRMAWLVLLGTIPAEWLVCSRTRLKARFDHQRSQA